MKNNDLVDWARGQWDRVGAWACIGLGLVALLLGWLGVSRTVYPAEQIPYLLSGGILAIFLLGVGVLLWLSADIRDTWRKLDDLDERLAESAESVARTTPGLGDPSTNGANGHTSTGGRRGRRAVAATEDR